MLGSTGQPLGRDSQSSGSLGRGNSSLSASVVGTAVAPELPSQCGTLNGQSQA